MKKRLNPRTGLPFQRWDKDENGRIFWAYSPKVRKSDGYFIEKWKTLENVPYNKPSAKKQKIDNPPRRLNPDTGKEFKRWDINQSSGKVFWNYEDKKPINDGEWCYELWIDSTNTPYKKKQEPQITYLKQCSKCDEWKIRTEDFHKSNRSFDGRLAACKKCDRARNENWINKNKEKFKKLVDDRYEKNKVQINQKTRERYANDQQYRKQKIVDSSLREERTKRATPPWVKREVLLPFYLEAQRKTDETRVVHHVDHIVPLKHELVCGLNVPANLQIISAEENLKKSNKFKVD